MRHECCQPSATVVDRTERPTSFKALDRSRRSLDDNFTDYRPSWSIDVRNFQTIFSAIAKLFVKFVMANASANAILTDWGMAYLTAVPRFQLFAFNQSRKVPLSDADN